MRIRNIQIISADTEYINKILGRLIAEIRNDIKIEVVTDVNYFDEIKDKAHPVDVLFIDESLSVGAIVMPAVKRVYIISERNDANAVSKFDGAAGILRILGDDVKKAGSGIGERECKVVDVVSPCGGCGKTIASLGLAFRLAQMNRKTLYVDAEYAQNFYEVMPKDSKKEEYSDEQMAVSMLNMTPKSFEYINQKIVHGTFDYIPPFKNYLAGYHLDPAKMVEAARVLANKGMYEYVIVEHGTGICREEIDNIYKNNRLVVIANVDMESERVKGLLKMFRGYTGQSRMVLHNVDNNDAGKNIDGFTLVENVSYQENESIDILLSKGSYKKIAEAIL